MISLKNEFRVSVLRGARKFAYNRLITFSTYRARQSSVFFSFSSVISFKMRINTDESVLVGGSGST